MTSETDPLGGSIQFSYDAAGQRTSFTNPNGAGRSWAYDAGGRVTSHADELGRITSYSYDSVGRQLSMTDPRGITTNRTFDAAGQLSQETAGGETRSFSYDSGGRVTLFSDSTGTTNLGWDPMGRLTSASSAAGTVGYSYNAAGERTGMTQPEGATSYSWNSNSHLVGLTDWRGDTASFNNDADGRMLSATLANGVSSSYGYDGAGRLISIGHNGPAGVIDSFNYTLDNNGNRVGVTSTEGAENYTLDALNRITAAAYPDGTNEAFNYDAAGNRTSHTQTDGDTVNYTHDAAGQLVSDSTGVNYSYDAAGNLTGTSAGDTYNYNAWGNLTEATLDGVTTTAAFDATGTRVQVDGIDQLWDRTGYGTLISTSTGDNYVHAPGMGILRDDTNWLLQDAIGSVRAITDTAGTVTASSAFTAFGEPRAAGSSVFGYAGEQTDPNSLVHLRARGYNPGLGSFTSYDPVQPGGPSTAGWNHYTYAGNNPSTWSDPTGQAAKADYGLGLLALGLLAVSLGVALAFTIGDLLVDRSNDRASAGGATSSTSTETHDDFFDAVDTATGTAVNSTDQLTQAEIDIIFEEIVNESLQPDPEPEPTVVPPPPDSFGYDCGSVPEVDDREALRRVAEDTNAHWDMVPVTDQTVSALSICIDTPKGPIGGVIVGGQPELGDAQLNHIAGLGAVLPAPELNHYAHAEEKAVSLARLIPNSHMNAIFATNQFCPFLPDLPTRRRVRHQRVGPALCDPRWKMNLVMYTDQLEERLAGLETSVVARLWLASIALLVEESPAGWPSRESVVELVDAWWGGEFAEIEAAIEACELNNGSADSSPRYFVLRALSGDQPVLQKLFRSILQRKPEVEPMSNFSSPTIDFASLKAEVTEASARYKAQWQQGPVAQEVARIILELIDAVPQELDPSQWDIVERTAASIRELKDLTAT